MPLVLEASLSKLEFDLLDFRGRHSNVPGFGHESNVFVGSLQMNVSYLLDSQKEGVSLIESLGKHQGCNHVDPHDCICGYTVFTLFCTAPEGSDIGPFCFPESGTFSHTGERLEGVRTAYGDVYVAILVFKGRSLHGGLAPRAFWKAANSTDGGNIVGVRVGLVAYPNGPAVNRTGSIAVAPPNGFSTSVNAAERLQHQRTMIQAGLTLFGTRANFVNWIAREYVFAHHNSVATAFSIVPFLRGTPTPLKSLLHDMTYEDEHGVLRRVSVDRLLDPVLDHDKYIRRARLLAHMRSCAIYFNYGITKTNVKAARQNAKAPVSKIPAFNPVKRSIPRTREALAIIDSRSAATVRVCFDCLPYAHRIAGIGFCCRVPGRARDGYLGPG